GNVHDAVGHRGACRGQRDHVDSLARLLGRPRQGRQEAAYVGADSPIARRVGEGASVDRHLEGPGDVRCAGHMAFWPPMGRLRVALVHPFSWPEVRRGGERLFHDLAWYLARAGHDVEMITGAWSGPSVEEVDGVRVRRIQLRELASLRRAHLGPPETFGALALPALLGARLGARGGGPRYDLVHALTPTGVLAARSAGLRSVYTVLGIPAEDDFALQPGSRRLFRAAVRSAS